MKFYRKQTTNIKNVEGRGVIVKANDEIVMDTRKSMKLPVGTAAERPLVPEEAQMRFLKTSTDPDPLAGKLEFYQDGEWKFVRLGEPVVIHQQTFSGADDVETQFGPLNNNDDENPTSFANSPQSLMVYIENVYQIPTTNYVIVQNPAGKDPGYYLDFGTAPPTGKDITVIHNFDK